MKRAALLAAFLLLVWLAPRLEAVAVKCLSSGCGKGQRPPACCNPPPCEFFYELKIARALVRATSTTFLGDTEASGDEEIRRFIRDNLQGEVRKAHKKYAKCPPSYFYRRVPSFSVSSSVEKCRIEGLGADGRSTGQSLEEALALSNSCSELVEAEYAEAQASQRLCWAYVNEAEPTTLAEFRVQERMKAQAKVDALEASLLQYWRACTRVMDATTARRIVGTGLDALKKAPAKKPAKRSPKRAGGPARRS
jgi:hypothetical protein